MNRFSPWQSIIIRTKRRWG